MESSGPNTLLSRTGYLLDCGWFAHGDEALQACTIHSSADAWSEQFSIPAGPGLLETMLFRYGQTTMLATASSTVQLWKIP